MDIVSMILILLKNNFLTDYCMSPIKSIFKMFIALLLSLFVFIYVELNLFSRLIRLKTKIWETNSVDF